MKVRSISSKTSSRVFFLGFLVGFSVSSSSVVSSMAPSSCLLSREFRRGAECSTLVLLVVVELVEVAITSGKGRC